jgi:peroxiredoxin
VAVSVDDVERNRRVVEKLGLDFPILSDANGETIADYGLVHRGGGPGGTDIARPATLLVGPDGAITWRSLTTNWRVRVRPAAVLEAIETLQGSATPSTP